MTFWFLFLEAKSQIAQAGLKPCVPKNDMELLILAPLPVSAGYIGIPFFNPFMEQELSSVLPPRMLPTELHLQPLILSFFFYGKSLTDRKSVV